MESLNSKKLLVGGLMSAKEEQSIFGGRMYATRFGGHKDQWWDNDDSGTWSRGDLAIIQWSVVADPDDVQCPYSIDELHHLGVEVEEVP